MARSSSTTGALLTLSLLKHMNKEQFLYQALVEEYGTKKLNELKQAVEKDRFTGAFPQKGDFEYWVVGYAISSVCDLMEEFGVNPVD
jgi:hypothetical protein